MGNPIYSSSGGFKWQHNLADLRLDKHIIEILGKPTLTLIWQLYLINESILYAFVYKSTALEMQQSDVQRYNIHMIFIHCEILPNLPYFI